MVNRNIESALFVGYLLSIDYVSINAALGLSLQLLHGVANRDRQTISLLENKIVWIIPVLNVDGFEFLLDYYKDRGGITFVYKNRHSDQYSNEDKCGQQGLGVNLNKNFPVGFNFDSDINSEDYPCSTNFGGVSPLSEPETKALDEFIKTVTPSMEVTIFTASKMICYPNLDMLDKPDPFIQSFKKFIERLSVYNEFNDGLSFYDPLKHSQPKLYSKGGNLDEYLLYKKSTLRLIRHVHAKLLHRLLSNRR